MQAQAAATAVQKIGGTTKLTAAEQTRLNSIVTEALEKYKALGITAPANLKKIQAETAKVQATTTTAMSGASAGVAGVTSTLTKMAGAVGIAFSAQAVLSFGKSVLDAGGNIKDFADQTGLSTKAIQQFGFAAEQGGADIETVSKAISNVSRNLIDNTAASQRALKNIGLSVNELKALQPEEAFKQIVAAIEGIEDPTIQSHAAMTLFGRAGKDLLPAIKDGFLDVAESAAVMSDETVEALARAGDELDRFSHDLTVAAAETLVMLKREFDSLKRESDIAFRAAFGPTEAERAKALEEWKDFYARLNVIRETGGTGVLSPDIQLRPEGVRPPSPPEGEGGSKSKNSIERFRDQIKELNEDIQRGINAGLITGVEAQERWGKAALKAAEDARFLGLSVSELPPELRSFADEAKRLETIDILRSGMPRFVEDLEKLKPALADLPKPFGDMSAAIKSSLQPLQVNYKTVQDINTALQPLPNSWEAVKQAEEEAKEESEKFVNAIDAASEAFGTLAQVSGGALGSVLGDIGKLLAGMNAARKAADAFSTGLQQLGVSEGTAGRIGKTASIGITGFSAGFDIAQATDSRTKGVLGGAATGALIGTAIAPGVGTAIGAAAGAIGGLFKGDGDKERDEFLKQAGGFDKLAKDLHQIGQDAVFENLRIAETTKDVEAAITDVEAAFAKYQARVEGLAASFDLVAQKQGVVSVDQLAELEDISGTSQGKQVAFDFLKQQTSSAAEGLNRLLSNAESLTQKSANAIGASLGSIFKEMQREGATTTDILRELEPQIDHFETLLSEAGLSSVPGFTALNRQLNTLQDERLGPLVESALGAGQAMAGLGNILQLTEGQFDGLGSVIVDTHKSLTLAGKGGTDALVLLQQPLQTAWQLSEDFGFSLDKATEKLVKEAEAAGLVGDKMRPLAEQQLKATESLIGRLDELLVALGVKLPEAGAKGAKELEKRLKAIKPPEIEGRVTWRIDPIPGSNAPSVSRNAKPREFATGGIVSSPMLGIVGEGPEPEIIAPFSKFMTTVALSATKLARGDRGRHTGPINLTIVQDGRETARAVLPHLANEMRVYVGR